MYYNFMISQFVSVDMFYNVTLYFVSTNSIDHKKIINNFKNISPNSFQFMKKHNTQKYSI